MVTGHGGTALKVTFWESFEANPRCWYNMVEDVCHGNRPRGNCVQEISLTWEDIEAKPRHRNKIAENLFYVKSLIRFRRLTQNYQ